LFTVIASVKYVTVVAFLRGVVEVNRLYGIFLFTFKYSGGV